ncbi:PepSY-associated TM helix domain-containing protein [Methylomonas methanica]|uniref:PepSY-associated TM helix domain protein n=1 Tax=Methylomonas methanica (strain DSM 25384 / MC09) TaxID=857087 RepID=G0A2Z3_METMM|nr:PepSY-associated TM helix domain-containing protein [Methylomonas methanica]AEG02652.1 PepSY-associated TM helix domain protein [Methylomonas methanica MC09]
MHLRHNNCRAIWLKLHLYLGLSAGFIFVILGLTGSIMVFWQIVDRWLEPQIVSFETICSPADYRPLDELIAAVQVKLPSEGQLKTVFFPHPERPVFRMVYQMLSSTYQGEFFDRYDLYVDPCTAKVNGPRLWEKLDQPFQGPVMAVIMRLHTGLLISKPPHWFGSHLIGAVGILLMLSIASGVYLWWPRKRKLKQAFTFKRNCGAQRRVFDIHKLSGVYGMAVLTTLVATGSTMYYPWHDLLRTAVQCLSPGTATESVQISKPTKNENSISPSLAIELAQQAVSGWKVKEVILPIKGTDAYLVTMESAKSVRKTRITLDRYSGVILDIHSGSQGTWGDVLLDWLFPLHTGEAFGMIGRFVVLQAGLLPAMLYITGVIRWLQKRRIKLARTIDLAT